MVHNRPKWYLFMLVPKSSVGTNPIFMVPTPGTNPRYQPHLYGTNPRYQPHLYGANNKGGAVVVVVVVVVVVGTNSWKGLTLY